jgi:hypothetical protein
MYNASQEQHEMILETIHPSGEEEWYCPSCGRRFLMQWPPNYHKVILEPGDESAIHSGGRGIPGAALNMQPSQFYPVEQTEQEPEIEIDEERLQPWIDWMERVNFDKLWE